MNTAYVILALFGIVIVAILVLMLAPAGPDLPDVPQARRWTDTGLLNNIIGNL